MKKGMMASDMINELNKVTYEIALMKNALNYKPRHEYVDFYSRFITMTQTIEKVQSALYEIVIVNCAQEFAHAKQLRETSMKDAKKLLAKRARRLKNLRRK